MDFSALLVVRGGLAYASHVPGTRFLLPTPLLEQWRIAKGRWGSVGGNGKLPVRGMGAAKRAMFLFFSREEILCLARFFRKGAVVVIWSFLVKCCFHCI